MAQQHFRNRGQWWTTGKKRALKRWSLTFLVGVFQGIIAFMCNMVCRILSDRKFEHVNALLHGIPGGGGADSSSMNADSSTDDLFVSNLGDDGLSENSEPTVAHLKATRGREGVEDVYGWPSAPTFFTRQFSPPSRPTSCTSSLSAAVPGSRNQVLPQRHRPSPRCPRQDTVLQGNWGHVLRRGWSAGREGGPHGPQRRRCRGRNFQGRTKFWVSTRLSPSSLTSAMTGRNETLLPAALPLGSRRPSALLLEAFCSVSRRGPATGQPNLLGGLLLRHGHPRHHVCGEES